MRPGCGLEFGVFWGCIAEHTLHVAKTAGNSPEHRLHKPFSTNKVGRGGLGPGLFADPSLAEGRKEGRESPSCPAEEERVRNKRRGIHVAHCGMV